MSRALGSSRLKPSAQGQGILGLVDERSGGTFDHIDDVIPHSERADYMATYKAAAGFAIEALDAAPPTISLVQR